jgi:pSer/pThr/pTyr-binding forkhead associated (FHA) protein
MHIKMVTITSPTQSKTPPISLSAGQSLVVGRSEQSDIQLSGDPTISSQHLRLSCDDHDVTLADLGSRNGSFVNGERVEKIRLTHNDEFQLGEYVFRVDLGEPLGMAEEQTVVDYDYYSRAQQKFGSGTLTLLYELPTGPAKKITVPRGQAVSVGRGAMADFEVQCRGLSQLHFRLKLIDQSAVVEDLNSSSGTVLNGRRIRSEELYDGDLIEAGSINFQVQLPNRPAAARPPVDVNERSNSVAPKTNKKRPTAKRTAGPHTKFRRKSERKPTKIQAVSKRITSTNLVAIEGTFENTNCKSLVKFCHAILGGFRLLVDCQRSGDMVPDELASKFQRSVLWSGPLVDKSPTTALTRFRSAAVAAAAYEDSIDADAAIGIASELSVTEIADRLQEIGDVWALGWPGFIRVACESGTKETVHSVFEFLSAILVEGEKSGDWIMYMHPETEKQILDMIEIE